jgi:hypothetical protein
MKQRICKDCLTECRAIPNISEIRALQLAKRRPATEPGPRCVTHSRAEKKRVRLVNAQRYINTTYEMPPHIYDAIYEFQGGMCPICQQAKGISKRLAVDHDHRVPGCTHAPDRGCEKCWRGLLCSRCNSGIAWFGPERLRRALAYYEDPPAQKVLLNMANTVTDGEVQ